VTTCLLLQDVDGTLAARERMWAHCLIDVLDLHEPGRTRCRAVRPLLRDGFPWHGAEIAPRELSTPEACWASAGASGVCLRRLRL
jgi:hypothetical protein